MNFKRDLHYLKVEWKLSYEVDFVYVEQTFI